MYKPIADYPLVGDCHGSALVVRDTSVDWCCLGRFDADPVFCRLLDDHEGGFLRTAPEGAFRFERSYVPGVRATQFFEFVKSIAGASLGGEAVRLAPVLIQPMAADVVATAVARIAVAAPVNGIVEIAGPQLFRLDALVRQGLDAQQDSREVIADPQARYFGAAVSERTLHPRQRCESRGDPFQRVARLRLRKECVGRAFTMTTPDKRFSSPRSA